MVAVALHENAVRDYEASRNPLLREAARNLMRYAAGRAIFCTACKGRLLDARYSVLRAEDGEPVRCECLPCAETDGLAKLPGSLYGPVVFGLTARL